MSIKDTPYRIRHAALSLSKKWRLDPGIVVPFPRLIEEMHYAPSEGPMGTLWWGGDRFDVAAIELCEPAPVFVLAPGRREHPDGTITDITEGT
jgi:hypothetical protein